MSSPDYRLQAAGIWSGENEVEYLIPDCLRFILIIIP